MNITKNETDVILAYCYNDIVGDYGYQSPLASAWCKDFAEEVGMNGKTFSGTMSSLVEKGLVSTNKEAFRLTEKGIEEATKIIEAIQKGKGG